MFSPFSLQQLHKIDSKIILDLFNLQFIVKNGDKMFVIIATKIFNHRNVANRLAVDFPPRFQGDRNFTSMPMGARTKLTPWQPLGEGAGYSGSRAPGQGGGGQRRGTG